MRRALKKENRLICFKRRNKQIKVFGVQGDFFQKSPCRVWAEPTKTEVQEAEPPAGRGQSPRKQRCRRQRLLSGVGGVHENRA